MTLNYRIRYNSQRVHKGAPHTNTTPGLYLSGSAGDITGDPTDRNVRPTYQMTQRQAVGVAKTNLRCFNTKSYNLRHCIFVIHRNHAKLLRTVAMLCYFDIP